jgi:hypothetical protein
LMRGSHPTGRPDPASPWPRARIRFDLRRAQKACRCRGP